MRPSTRKWLLFLMSLAALFGASTRLASINAQREEHHLVLPPLPEHMGASLLYSPLLALGRAPLVDILWLRATKLKDEGRFFDALQLSQRICELQPKFASVWVFQAWNMAYNISVTLKSPEERWRWVRNGYELLRDKGIPLNPNNTELYRELAWIFFHKVGDFMDDWHWYYKLQFALEMEGILGQPPPGFVRPGIPRGDFYRDYDYQSLADAPLRYDQLLAEDGVKTLADGLEDFGFDTSEPGIYLGLLASVRSGELRVPDTPEHEQENRKQALLAFVNDPDLADARVRMEKYWRAYKLRNGVKLDPKRIVELQEALGVTLDFRLAETHALYWANLGLEMGTDKRAALDIHRLNTNRIEFYCLQKMFHRGRMAMSRNAHLGEPPLLSPDIRVVPPLFQAFLTDSKKYLSNEKTKDPVSTNFKTGFVGFSRSAILRYHELGMQKEANDLFDYLRKSIPDPMYENGLDGFLLKQVGTDRELNNYRIALARIEALLRRGLLHLAYDEDEEATRYLARAKQVYLRYQSGVVSKGRQQFKFSFDEIVRQSVHMVGGQMYRGSYVHLCQKMGIQPLPESADEPQPAAAPR